MTLRYEEPLRRFRFLLSDGRVLDVEARRDDSNLRAWVLEQAGIKIPKTGPLVGSIAGVVEVADQEGML